MKWEGEQEGDRKNERKNRGGGKRKEGERKWTRK
jgi:hypothetical protein